MVLLNCNYSKRIIPFSLLESTANKMVGIKYAHLGRDWMKGLDCFGCVIEFFRRLGLMVEDIPGYGLNWWKSHDLIGMYNKDMFEEVLDVTPGMILSLWIHGPVPSHLAVVLPRGMVLNTDMFAGVHKTRFFAIRHRIKNVYKHKLMEVTDG
jgi:hypothetical protein